MNNELQLSDPDFWKHRKEIISETGVVYIIRSKPNSNYKSIQRVLANDEEGILYIGEGRGESRLARLVESVSPSYNSANHGFGVKFKSDPRFQEQFPYETLYIELIATNAHKQIEKEKLSDYEERFGELPPFNKKS